MSMGRGTQIPGTPLKGDPGTDGQIHFHLAQSAEAGRCHSGDQGMPCNAGLLSSSLFTPPFLSFGGEGTWQAVRHGEAWAMRREA